MEFRGVKGKRGWHSLAALLVQSAHSESHSKANLVYICVPISRGFLHVERVISRDSRHGKHTPKGEGSGYFHETVP